MAWQVQFEPNTNRNRVGSVRATWTEPTGEVFTFIDDQVNTNNDTQLATFVSRAKTRLAAWQTALNSDKAVLAQVKSTIEGLLNA